MSLYYKNRNLKKRSSALKCKACLFVYKEYLHDRQASELFLTMRMCIADVRDSELWAPIDTSKGLHWRVFDM